MSAYNDRRIGKERREGDRRWLGTFKDFVKDENTSAGSGKRNLGRRIHEDRRAKHNPLSNISF